MPDPIFSEPRLAAVYDTFDGDRSDLDVYAAIVEEFAARRIIDIGCGTGAFACILAKRGYEVTGVDPALASLNVAQSRPFARRVEWIHGTVEHLPVDHADLAVMTGNVAQVFTEDEDWLAALQAAHRTLRPDGRLIFEVRDPAARAWERWTPELTRKRRDVPGIGIVEMWTDVTRVALPLVSFRHTYRFASDGAVLTSDSTLRFRQRMEIEASLSAAGFTIDELREAPDRPGLELVFVARTSKHTPQPAW